jgi:hypothetical protein
MLLRSGFASLPKKWISVLVRFSHSAVFVRKLLRHERVLCAHAPQKKVPRMTSRKTQEPPQTIDGTGRGTPSGIQSDAARIAKGARGDQFVHDLRGDGQKHYAQKYTGQRPIVRVYKASGRFAPRVEIKGRPVSLARQM